jgi:hypothetical protein
MARAVEGGRDLRELGSHRRRRLNHWGREPTTRVQNWPLDVRGVFRQVIAPRQALRGCSRRAERPYRLKGCVSRPIVPVSSTSSIL